MISDVLSDAAFEIRDYLTNQPTGYAEKRARILAVVKAMEDLRSELDVWGLDDPTGPRASVQEALDSAIHAKMPPR